MATADNGLAAVLYAPSAVRAKVGDGTEVALIEETAYPFEEEIRLSVACDRPVEFPLYLRLPGWARAGRVVVNGQVDAEGLAGGGYAVVRRTWRHGDQVRLELGAPIEIVTWPVPQGAVSVRRGPLWYALRIGEKWQKYGGTEAWPALELLPTTPWNYGLLADGPGGRPDVGLAARRPPAYQPFAADAAPLVLSVRARRVTGWTLEGRMVGQVPASPAKADGPSQDVELIPMGCARLRITVFPTVGH
jgi:hypothetical protein